MSPSWVQSHGGGGIYYEPIYDDVDLIIKNSAIINNVANQWSGGLFINAIGAQIVHPLPTFNVEIVNSTFSDNMSHDGKGSAFFIAKASGDFHSHLNFELNSCTIANNGGFTTIGAEENNYAIYCQYSEENSNIKIKNSIITNSDSDNMVANFFPNTDIDTPEDISPYCYNLSYCITDDTTLPEDIGVNNFLNTDPLLTPLRSDYGIYVHKIKASSPAKDAIPKGGDTNNPFNGAGNYLVDVFGNPILDEHGNIQVLDQRGFNVWNQKKDIGAYESPYYWIESKMDDIYHSDPNWTIELKVYDPVEQSLDPDGYWDDYIRVEDDCEFQLSELSHIEVEEGSEVTLGSTSNMNCGLESSITFKNGVTFNVNGSSFSSLTGTDTWQGIVAEVGSTVNLSNVTINDAVTGISALDSDCNILNSTFDNCNNGVELINCSDYTLNNNFFYGSGVGSGISIILSDDTISGDGKIIENTIENHRKGISITSCSPFITDNVIRNNVHSGLYITGLNSHPQLIKVKDNTLPYNYLNNEIYGNGYIPSYPVPTFSLPAQINIRQGGNIYMQYGHNNVYSNSTIGTSSVPRIVAAKLIPEGEIPREEFLYVQGNYWGSNTVIDDYFVAGEGYGIIYDPYATSPFGGIPSTSPPVEPDSKSYDLLVKALVAELDGKNDKAIKTYEKLIDKYPDSEEALVAYTKLPSNYIEEGLSLEPLITSFDENIENSEDQYLKKFFQEMKVTANIRSKKYDDAIVTSEEMLAEADAEEEEILCEIDIAIANMMKNHSNNGKNRSAEDFSKTLNDLLARLNGDNEERTSINNEQLTMNNYQLEQNYPNPFNPTTEIKFSLTNASEVKLSVFNINGQLVSELVNGEMNAGIHTVNFDGNNLNSGIYFYTLEANGISVTKKMVLTK